MMEKVTPSFWNTAWTPRAKVKKDRERDTDGHVVTHGEIDGRAARSTALKNELATVMSRKDKILVALAGSAAGGATRLSWVGVKFALAKVGVTVPVITAGASLGTLAIGVAVVAATGALAGAATAVGRNWWQTRGTVRKKGWWRKDVLKGALLGACGGAAFGAVVDMFMPSGFLYDTIGKPVIDFAKNNLPSLSGVGAFVSEIASNMKEQAVESAQKCAAFTLRVGTSINEGIAGAAQKFADFNLRVGTSINEGITGVGGKIASGYRSLMRSLFEKPLSSPTAFDEARRAAAELRKGIVPTTAPDLSQITPDALPQTAAPNLDNVAPEAPETLAKETAEQVAPRRFFKLPKIFSAEMSQANFDVLSEKVQRQLLTAAKNSDNAELMMAAYKEASYELLSAKAKGARAAAKKLLIEGSRVALHSESHSVVANRLFRDAADVLLQDGQPQEAYAEALMSDQKDKTVRRIISTIEAKFPNVKVNFFNGLREIQEITGIGKRPPLATLTP